jgi:hypothetical protein
MHYLPIPSQDPTYFHIIKSIHGLLVFVTFELFIMSIFRVNLLKYNIFNNLKIPDTKPTTTPMTHPINQIHD